MRPTYLVSATLATHLARVVSVVGVVAMWLCGTPSAWAQPAQRGVSPPIPHSGVITDAAGQPIADSIPVVFALYGARVGGVSLWLEVQTVQTDANGRYQVLLGSVTGLPRNLFASERQLWLGVQPAGQRLEQPRVRFTPGITTTTTTTADEAEQTGAQPEPAPDEALRVFLDCLRCDDDYLRQEITYLNYVVDREDAQVHVLVTTQPTGGGTEFTFAFIGLEAFAGRDDEVRFFSSDTDTEDEQREGIAQTLQLGLLPYLAGTPLAAQVEIFHAPDAGLGATQPEDDPWNYWVFNSNLSADFDSEELQSGHFFFGSFSASRTTEAWDIRMGVNGSFNADEFDLGDGDSFRSTTETFDLTGLVIGSLTDHWSWAVDGSLTTSTFLNQDLSVRIAPGIEYNIFPYDESTRRQLTLSYSIGLNRFRYEELTLFGETDETRVDGTLIVSLDLNQPWGRSGVALEVAQFLDDPGQNRVVGFGNLEFRVLRGLSLSIFGSASRLRDQIFLPAGGLTPEEVLVRRRQQETGFQVSLSVGVTITFGSIYNNVVNSRFAGGSGGLVRVF